MVTAADVVTFKQQLRQQMAYLAGDAHVNLKLSLSLSVSPSLSYAVWLKPYCTSQLSLCLTQKKPEYFLGYGLREEWEHGAEWSLETWCVVLR